MKNLAGKIRFLQAGMIDFGKIDFRAITEEHYTLGQALLAAHLGMAGHTLHGCRGLSFMRAYNLATRQTRRDHDKHQETEQKLSHAINLHHWREKTMKPNLS